jgi:hypothetical protein
MTGGDVRTLKALGGWKSLDMVARYAHLSTEHQRAAVERLAPPGPTATAISRTVSRT